MTPLVQKMARLTPDAHKFMWFDIGPTPEEFEFNVDAERLVHLPFDRTAFCGTDNAGVDFVIVLFKSNELVSLSGWAIEQSGIKVLLQPVAYKNVDGVLEFHSVPHFPNPGKKYRVRMIGLVERFLHCLNQTSEAYTATPKKTFLNRARIKKGKPALSYEWHTVKIERPQPKYEPKGGTHASPRLHDRRGHWRNWKGKRVWVRQCVVGDPERGVIEKDYEVRA